MSKNRLTEQELREIEQRAERATKGPWVIISIDDVFAYVCFDSLPYKVAEVLSLRDAEFIVHAREDIPRLIAEVRRLRESLHEIANVDEGHSSIDCNIMRDLARRALGGELMQDQMLKEAKEWLKKNG